MLSSGWGLKMPCMKRNSRNGPSSGSFAWSMQEPSSESTRIFQDSSRWRSVCGCSNSGRPAGRMSSGRKGRSSRQVQRSSRTDCYCPPLSTPTASSASWKISLRSIFISGVFPMRLSAGGRKSRHRLSLNRSCTGRRTRSTHFSSGRAASGTRERQRPALFFAEGEFP